MSQWHRIACAVDFSEAARVAMEEAADQAARFQSELLLVHVNESAASAGDMPPAPAALLASRHELERKLEVWRTEAERRSARPVVAEVVEGSPAEEIVRLATARNADLLVVGTHGRRGWRHLVIGSVAERVVRTSHCPVLVVPRQP